MRTYYSYFTGLLSTTVTLTTLFLISPAAWSNENSAETAQPPSFFNIGGPNKRPNYVNFNGAANSKAATPTNSSPQIPNPELFTKSANPNDTVREHPFRLFGGANNIQTPPQQSKAHTNANSVAPPQNPNPALFTKSANPNDTVREHPFRLFGGSNGSSDPIAPQQQTNAPAPTANAPTSASATASTPPEIPDPDLFTQPANPNDTVREHPFRLF